MNPLKQVIIFSSIVVFFCAFQNGWKTIDKKEYSLEIPDNWKEIDPDENFSQNMEMAFTVPQKKGENPYLTMLTLVITDVGENFDLNRHAGMRKARIPNSEKGIVLECKPFGLGYMLVYTGKLGDNDLKYEEVIFAKNGKCFTLKFGTSESLFSSYIPSIDKIFNSFKLKI